MTPVFVGSERTDSHRPLAFKASGIVFTKVRETIPFFLFRITRRPVSRASFSLHFHSQGTLSAQLPLHFLPSMFCDCVLSAQLAVPRPSPGKDSVKRQTDGPKCGEKTEAWVVGRRNRRQWRRRRRRRRRPKALRFAAP
ncbi:hypothetical protein HPB48_003084 [Haemaphysalis longicornis]|uniref:Uncharacterized protein n=1 Tax=Haemaphysalis longicornis TaxID=44386 RepID=A0A9J6G3Y1_HAELO|nr:hypothetical protein HPB48_003084 [Haemaphysalis longicornis]